MLEKLLMLTLTGFLINKGISQHRVITGKVTSGGEPLESATITNTKTHLGARTAANGEYRLENISGDGCQLLISHIGYFTSSHFFAGPEQRQL